MVTAGIDHPGVVIIGTTLGMQRIVRAYNSMRAKTWILTILTLRPLPPGPAGLKAVALLIEASCELISWAPFAVFDAALGKEAFFGAPDPEMKPLSPRHEVFAQARGRGEMRMPRMSPPGIGGMTGLPA